MYWIKAVVHWDNAVCCCSKCGTGLFNGKRVYLLLDSEMKIVEIRCPSCFHSSFPEGL